MWWMVVAQPVLAATIDDLFVHASPHNIGVMVTLDGANGSEVVALRWRPVGGVFTPAHDLVNYDARGWAGSVFDVLPDTLHEVEVTVDGDVRVSLVHTPPTFQAPAPVRVVVVGSDAQLQQALADVRPGDELRLAPGTYGPVSVFGVDATAAQPIVLRADEPANLPVIDGGGTGRALDLEQCSHIIVDGLVIENGGDTADGIGLRIHSSAHISVLGSEIHDNGRYNVLISKSNQYADGEGGHHLVKSNLIYDSDPGDCAGASNQACPDQTYYGVQLDNHPGPGNRITDNELYGHVDNIVLCGNEQEARSLAPDSNVLLWTGGSLTNHDAEATHNTSYDARDDDIELDGVCVNARVLYNAFGDAENPISVAPALPGPYWIVRNTVTGRWGQGAVKLNTAGEDDIPIRNIFLYHNSFVRDDAGPLLNLWYAVPGDHNVPIARVVFRNNLLWSPEGACTDVSAGGDDNPTFDGDHWSCGVALFEWWNGTSIDTYTQFADFQAGTGEEAGGGYGDPLVDADLVPMAASPLLDAALVIPGINDRFGGSGPDIGAFEVDDAAPGTTPPTETTPPQTGTDGPTSPAPTDDPGTTPADADAPPAQSCGCGSASPQPWPRVLGARRR